MSKQNNNQDKIYDRWVWLDLEMTGLDDSTCSILQVAMIITDHNFNILAEKEISVWQPESVLATMVPLVKSMHTKNGLLDKVRTSDYSLMQAEQELMAILSKHVEYKKGVLAGNSIYVDRRFLQKYMISFENFLHYRQIDVSSLKIISQAWYGQKAKPPKKASNHTALEDIKDSIDELKFYKNTVFVG